MKWLPPHQAIRAFCRECDPEPRAAYLRCQERGCPLWRHRCGSPARYGRGTGSRITQGQESVQVLPQNTSALDRARLLILKADSEVTMTGKRHGIGTGSISSGELDYRPGERPLKAVARHCRDCMGDLKPSDCCSPNCALAPYRFGRRPRPGDVAPVPNIPAGGVGATQ